VTKGYTIENYVPTDVLRDAVLARHRKTRFRAPSTEFASPMQKGWDKVAVARAVADRWTDETAWPLDLRAKVRSIASAIRQANGLPALD